MRDIATLYGSENFADVNNAKDLGAEYLMELLNENQSNIIFYRTF